LVENAHESRKGFASSFQQMSQGAGVMLAGLVGLMLTHLFSDAQIAGGAWRLAFAFGLLIGPVGWYVRRSIPETAAFEQAGRQNKARLWPQLIEYRWRLLCGVGILVFWTIATYVSNYFTTYAVRELHMSLFDSYLGQLGYGIVMVSACPLAGMLSDRIGVRKPMLAGALITAVAAYPLFWLLAQHPDRLTLIAVQMIISLLLACYAACASRVLADIFPVQFRATGVGFSYATGVTIFGGLTPLLVTGLIRVSGDKLIVGYYLAAAALISCIPVVLSARKPSSSQQPAPAALN
ncbi:MFS transporter, partial [Trinickia sp.]|uniref:MFS transporter n=1 Tax=Trinickia sp. TaxID=2571163 RepID=UPI003F8125E2